MRDDAYPAGEHSRMVRPLTVDDLEGAVTVAESAFDEPLTRDGLAALLALPSVFGIAACSGGSFVGFILVRVAGDEGEVLWLAVQGEFRRRHLGALLLDGALVVAATRGATRMVLEVAETNSAARSLYATHGFKAVGRRPAYYRGADGLRLDGLILARGL